VPKETPARGNCGPAPADELSTGARSEHSGLNIALTSPVPDGIVSG
jgi:hypothetical protein